MSWKFLKPAGLCVLLLMLGVPLSAQAQHTHELEKNFCILKIGPYGMHLTGYQPDLSAGKESCGEVPGTGRTVLVLDYIEGELRSVPVEVRIIRDTGSEQDLQAITVLLDRRIEHGFALHALHHDHRPARSDRRWSSDLLFRARSA
jgi:hypothetical protein